MEISSITKRYLQAANLNRNSNQQNVHPLKYVPIPLSRIVLQPKSLSPIAKPQREYPIKSSISSMYLQRYPSVLGTSVINKNFITPAKIVDQPEEEEERNDRTFIIHRKSDELKENAHDMQLSFMTSDYFSNSKTKSPHVDDLFSPPPTKRLKATEDYSNFFETQSNALMNNSNGMTMSFLSQTDNKISTQSLFGEKSITSSVINRQIRMLPRPSSLDSYEGMSFVSKCIKKESATQSSDSSFMSIVSSRAHRMVEKYQKKNENRFFKLYSTDTDDPFEITIDMDYGKTHRPTSLFRKKFQEEKCEEIPTFDNYKTLDKKVFKKFFNTIFSQTDIDNSLEIGDLQSLNLVDDFEDIEDVSYDYGEIAESMEEIEQSFCNPVNIIASTPEHEKKIIKQEKQEVVVIKQEAAEEIIEIEENFDELTHISPSNDFLKDNNYEFALNSILCIKEKNVTPKENRKDASERIDWLLSAIREENLMDVSLLPANTNKEIAEERRAVIMMQIEGILETVITSLANQKAFCLKIRKVKDFKDCKMSNQILSERETSISVKKLSFSNKNTERTFTILVHLMCEAYKMLSHNISCSKRELYYRDVKLLQSQTYVNKAIEDICILLNVSQWELGILSTSKGLVAGDLKIMIGENNTEIDCSASTRGVPQNPSEITAFHSNASFVLIVEKDTVFTRLVQEKIFEKTRNKLILVTAKGYPDIPTRIFLNRIESELKIPIYILVDADPHGIEIMCTYKYGSLGMVHNNQNLAVTSAKWIGIHPSDIDTLDITHMNLTEAELKKVDELLNRPYVHGQLQRELNLMKMRKLKAEIEGLYNLSLEFIINNYIPQKIRNNAEPLSEILSRLHGSEATPLADID